MATLIGMHKSRRYSIGDKMKHGIECFTYGAMRLIGLHRLSEHLAAIYRQGLCETFSCKSGTFDTTM